MATTTTLPPVKPALLLSNNSEVKAVLRKILPTFLLALLIGGLLFGISKFSELRQRKNPPLVSPVIGEVQRTVSLEVYLYGIRPKVTNLKKGETIKLVFRSIDVNHKLVLDELNTQVEVSPQKSAEIIIKPDKKGMFLIRSTNLEYQRLGVEGFLNIQ